MTQRLTRRLREQQRRRLYSALVLGREISEVGSGKTLWKCSDEASFLALVRAEEVLCIAPELPIEGPLMARLDVF